MRPRRAPISATISADGSIGFEDILTRDLEARCHHSERVTIALSRTLAAQLYRLVPSPAQSPCGTLCLAGRGWVTRHRRHAVAFDGVAGDQIDQARRPVHDRLVRRVVADVIVIYDEAGVERRVFVGVVEGDALEILEDRPIHRSVEETAAQLFDPELPRHGRVWGVGPDAIVRPADHHRRAPWIGPEEPVHGRLLVFPVALVAGHAAVKHRLRRKRRYQIVRAPDEWNADPEAIGRASDDRFEPALIVVFHLALDAGA